MNTRQWALSAVIVVHLAAVLLGPNPDSYLTWASDTLLKPYRESLGMDGTWSFFAPEPWRADFYEYDVIESSGRETQYTFPAMSSPYWFRSTYNRRIALMRAVSKNSRAFKAVLVPGLCHEHPEAVSVRVRAVSMASPTVDDVRQGHTINDLTDASRRQPENLGEFSCPTSPL